MITSVFSTDETGILSLRKGEWFMSMKLALGIDFGSLSARALLVDLKTGQEAATAVCLYQHGCMEDVLPSSGEKLKPGWALQDPQDYLDALSKLVPTVLKSSGASPEDIIGVGIDFTASTVLPILKDGTPLCFLPEFRNHRHAYAKMWKHHAAQDQACRMNDLAKKRGEPFLSRYGGKISEEWLFPKLLQTLEEAPDVYCAMDRFIEAADWIVMVLCGEERRSGGLAGYKALWDKRSGYPKDDYFSELDPRLTHVIDDKLSRDLWPIASKAGEVTPSAAAVTGLLPGTAVAVGHIDAHVAVPGVGITEEGQMLIIMGTSNCHMLLGQKAVPIEGICGVVEDGIFPGLFGYEAGQPCVGDLLDWFVREAVPPETHKKAQERGFTVHQILRDKAQHQKPGAGGLLALDWWNGNRSLLTDGDLSGLLVGFSLDTKTEDIYRALMEATAFGTRMIIERFESSGIPVNQLFACGGIARNDPFMMQIYADVMQKDIHVIDSSQSVALGAALHGAVAAGSRAGGFDNLYDATRSVSRKPPLIYRPVSEYADLYTKLYKEYCELHDLFGLGGCPVMKRLKTIQAEALERETR